MKYKGIRGTIITANEQDKLDITENGTIILDDGGTILGVYASDALPELYKNADIEDYGNSIITTSFCDMHLHAPQYPMLGLGMDLPLMQWLYNYTFRTEALFKDTAFARDVYSVLARELIARGTTRVCAFSSVHTDSSLVLMEELERAGVFGYVGKVSMDRNTTDELMESTEGAISEERRFIEESLSRFTDIHPMLTPRFTPSCTDELMRGLGELGREYGIRAQSHLSENFEEIETVHSLCPDCERYYQTYERAGLWNEGTVMAHCVHSDSVERAAMKAAGVWVAHSPNSNTNIYSGIAPVRRMINEGLNVSLGSDIAGGDNLSMRHVACAAIRVSKLRYYYADRAEEERFLDVAEAFSLSSSRPRRFFDLSYGFEAGEKLEAVVLSDVSHGPSIPLNPQERFERLIYSADPSDIRAVYSLGVRRL